MDSIEVNKMMDFIVVEKHDGNVILEGSKLFCGCCGKPLCTLLVPLRLPFDSVILVKSVKDRTFNHPLIGLYHRTCGHLMFPLGPWNFIPLASFLELQKQKQHDK